MILSTTTGEIAKRLGDEEAIRIIAQAGFDAFDYSLFAYDDESPVYGVSYKEYVAGLIDTAQKYYICCNQAHAYFPSNKWGDEEFNKKTFGKIVRGMEVAAMLGAKTIIVHPFTSYPKDMTPEKIMEVNLFFYNSLLPYCKEFKIRVALENMFTRDKKRGYIIGSTCGRGEEFRAYMEALDSQWFIACLDLGHSSLVGDEAYDAIRVLGKKYLHALHVSDNDYCNDNHTLPYLGSMEWNKIFQALAEIGYKDDFTYEADSFISGFPDDFLPDVSAFMCKVGRYMIRRIEEEKTSIRSVFVQ